MAKKKTETPTLAPASLVDADESPAAPREERSYQGLARKWRPRDFSDLIGQEDVAQSLMNSLSEGKFAHGHILSGPRGVGKTTSARILARALCCEQGVTPKPCGKCAHCVAITAGNDLDVLEIDAASNTKVEQTREMLETVVRAPFAARYKVYIIDEVHMLSQGSFNALLKTLEEPPPQVVFIFATTELEKIPETVRSRCALHPFRRLSSDDITRRLTHVARGEGIKLDEAAEREVYGLIAQSAEGGMRDALVALDQLLAMTQGKPDVDSAQRLLGLTSRAALAETVNALAAGDALKLLAIVEDLVNRGRSLERYVKGLISHLHDIMLLQAGADTRLVALTGDALTAAKTSAEKLARPQVFNFLNQLFELEEKMKRSTQSRFLIEFAFLRMAVVKPVLPIEDLIDRLKALPAASASAAPVAPITPAPTAAMMTATDTPISPTPRREFAGAAVAERTPAYAPRLERALAMRDSEGESETAPRASSAGSGVNPLAGLSHAELIESVTAQLPDSLQFLTRYLRIASAMRADGGTLAIQWPKDERVASKMIAKPENKKALESALAQICGRPMIVEWDFATRPAEVAVAPPRSKALAPRAFADSQPMAEGLSESNDEPPMDYSFIEREASAQNDPYAGMSYASAEELPAQLQTPTNPSEAALPRVTAESTRQILASGGDLARRAKMVKDFFKGEFADSDGRALAL